MDKTITRNTAETLTFTKSGDYSSDAIKFTVKADRTLTSARLIDKSASVSYSGSVSTITVSLDPSDSGGLSSSSYYYDLRVENDETDRESLFDGNLYVNKSVRNDTDGSTITDTSNVITLDSDDFDDDDLIGKSSGSITGFNKVEVKNLLGIEPHYSVIQQFTGNGSTILNSNPTLFTNDIPNATIDTDWTRSKAGVYYKNITGSGFGATSFSSKKIKRDGVILDENLAEAIIGMYITFVAWTGSTWRLYLYTSNISGVWADLTFLTSPHLIETGLNSA